MHTSYNCPLTSSVAFIGDICTAAGGVPKGVLGSCLEALQQDALLIANIENCISTRGQKISPKYACLRGDPLQMEGLRKLSVAVLGNNHISDYGCQAAIDTIDHLKQLGINTQGYGNNLKEALAPLIIERNGIKICILSFSCPTTNGWNTATPVSPGVAPLSMPLVRDQILGCRSQADVVFIYLHWGVEQSHYPTPGQIAAARQMIDWGADSVIGVHAHVIQPYEKYKNGYIFYGLGNAIFRDIEFRQWAMDGSMTNGVLKLRSGNLESLVPIFRVEKRGGVRTCLERVVALRFNDVHITDVPFGALTVNPQNLNRNLKVYSFLYKRFLAKKAFLGFRLLHNGGYHYCVYADKPIDQAPIWKLYYRVSSIVGSSVRAVVKKALDYLTSKWSIYAIQ